MTRNRRPGDRAGYTLIEVVMAVFLLTAAMTLTVKFLGWVTAERRDADRRLVALGAVSNGLERVAAEPFEKVTPDRVKTLAAEAAYPFLPRPEWAATVDPDDAGPVPGKRVTLQLRWQSRAGHYDAPVRLTAWVYRKGAPK